MSVEEETASARLQQHHPGDHDFDPVKDSKCGRGDCFGFLVDHDFKLQLQLVFRGAQRAPSAQRALVFRGAQRAPSTQLAFSQASFQSDLQPSLLNINYKSTGFWTRSSTSSPRQFGFWKHLALDPRSAFPGGSRKFLQFPIFPKVGPKPGEQRRTQVSTSASSGDLQPPLGEELRAPSGARPACCPPLQLAVLRSLGERRDQVPGEPPAVLGDHAYHQVPLFPNCVVPAASIPAVACSSMPHCPGVLLQQLGRLPCNAYDGYAYHCI